MQRRSAGSKSLKWSKSWVSDPVVPSFAQRDFAPSAMIQVQTAHSGPRSPLHRSTRCPIRWQSASPARRWHKDRSSSQPGLTETVTARVQSCRDVESPRPRLPASGHRAQPTRHRNGHRLRDGRARPKPRQQSNQGCALRKRRDQKFRQQRCRSAKSSRGVRVAPIGLLDAQAINPLFHPQGLPVLETRAVQSRYDQDFSQRSYHRHRIFFFHRPLGSQWGRALSAGGVRRQTTGTRRVHRQSSPGLTPTQPMGH